MEQPLGGRTEDAVGTLADVAGHRAAGAGGRHQARQIANIFGAPRGRDRTHAGIDIFAKRGTPVRSATAGVVADVSERGLGGRQVWVIGPARERYYYAHLDDWADGLARGQVVQRGDLLGHVGDSGNAKGTPPHLHWGIYGTSGARDPLPLLR